MTTQCEKPIEIKDIQKYKNTIAALRSGVLKTEYIKINSYRTDEESEARVGTLEVILPIMILFFLIILVLCFWKIR